MEKAQKDSPSKYNLFSKQDKLQKKKDKVEQEVENLQKKLEAQQEKTDTKTKEVEVKEAEVQQLQEEGQRMETSLQTLMEEVEIKWPLVSRQKFEEEQLRREEAERKVHILEEKLRREEAEKKAHILEEKLQKKTDALLADIQNLKDEKQKSENMQKDLEATRKEFEKKLQEEKRGREEAERKLKDLKKEFQEGNCEGSGSVEPPLTPNAETSDPGFNIEVDQQHTYIRLRNTSTEDKGMGQWKLDLQVNNNKSITYTFTQSFKLKAGRDVTMWVEGHGRNHAPTELKWRDLKSLSSGDKLQVVLFNQKQEIQYELCVTIP